MKKLDIEIALAEGFRTILEKPSIIFPSIASSLLFSCHIYLLMKLKSEGSISPNEAVYLLEIAIAVILLGIYFDSVVVRLAYTKSSIFEAFGFALKKYPTVPTAMILYALIVALGSIALVIPGIYLAVRLYYFIDAILIDEKGVISSLKTSWRIVRGNWWATFSILIIIGLFSILMNTFITSALSVVQFGKYLEIGAFVQAPITAVFRAWSYLAFVNAYLQLKNRQTTLLNFRPTERT